MLEFLKAKNDEQKLQKTLIQSIIFFKYLAFLIDLTTRLNIFNLYVQYRGQNICQHNNCIEDFRKKIINV